MYPESKVILRADDRGNDPAVSKGIDRLIEMGLLTQATVIAQYTGPKEFETLFEACRISPFRDTDITLHFNIVSGKPVSPPELVSSLLVNGVFKRPTDTKFSSWINYLKDGVILEHIDRELDAQINKFINDSGGSLPNSINGHNYPETVPGISELLIKKAEQLKIPLNVPIKRTESINPGPFSDALIIDYGLISEFKKKGIVTGDYGIPTYYNRHDTLDKSVREFYNDLRTLTTGVTEFCFHPGDPDAIKTVGIEYDQGRFVRGRVRDFQILTYPTIKNVINSMRSQGRLTSYKQLTSLR